MCQKKRIAPYIFGTLTKNKTKTNVTYNNISIVNMHKDLINIICDYLGVICRKSTVNFIFESEEVDIICVTKRVNCEDMIDVNVSIPNIDDMFLLLTFNPFKFFEKQNKLVSFVNFVLE